MRLTPIVLALLLLAPPALAQTWAQENTDPANRGRLAQSAPDALGGDGFHALDGRVITQPIEGPAELAIAATRAGSVYVLDAQGEAVWRADVGEPVRTAPTWTGSHVVVAPRSDTAHAFTLTGEEAWTVEIGNDRDTSRGEEIRLVRMASPVAHPGGGVIVADLEGEVQRVADDGGVEWTYAFGEDLAVEATPAITGEGDVIAAAFTPNQEGRGFLARIDGDTGNTDCGNCWRVDIGAQVVGAPTVTGDRVLVPLRDGDALQARSLRDGSLRWETAFDDSVPASPSLHEGLAIVGDIRGTLRAVQVSGGVIEWEFNPLGDDPAGELTTSQCTALTIADSVAVDRGGTAWVPFWKADICSGFPPEDSRESPFYLLDAGTGEVLDRERYPKANHGPALLGNGVWVGSDEGGVRSYPHGSGIATFVRTQPGEALLVVNTDETGSWSISWDGNVTRSGEARPPVFNTVELSPGEHSYRITAGDGAVSGTARVPAPAADETGSSEEEPEPDDGTSTDDSEEPASTDEASNESAAGEDGGEDRGAPLGPVVALLALGLAARRRARA